MKISTRGRYGLRIMLDLALHRDDRVPRMIRDIAAAQNISEKYISRLIIDLRKAGMVKSVRGAKGGYRIARFPEMLTVLDIVEVMEGPVSIVDCVRSPDSCEYLAACAVQEIWQTLNNDIRASLAKVTLQDIVDRQKRKEADAGCMEYCI